MNDVRLIFTLGYNSPFQFALWCGLEETPGTDIAGGSNAWHEMRASVEHDASSEVRR